MEKLPPISAAVAQKRFVIPSYEGQEQFHQAMARADKLQISDHEAEYGVVPTEQQKRGIKKTPRALQSVEGSY